MPTAEDVAAAAVHAAGLLIAAGLGTRLVRAGASAGSGVRWAERWAVVIFVAAWLTLYLASILFHLTPQGGLRRIFAALDHGAIFLIIAAGWSPLAPFKLPPRQAGWMLALVWGAAALGIGGEVAAAAGGRREWFYSITYALYMVQGWAPVLLYGRTIFHLLSPASLVFLFGSAVAYTAGILFYRRPELPWNHVIWHVAVVVGCLLNFGGVWILLKERRIA
ncbi:hypothetical protein HB662_27250 [Roseomonas frigidaquae]|uniref:Hemolysin III n=1 Tax=Falsiroseomonas frigidaquae TaxID=487318 RepID=A0ABX1F7Z4_9PROT|nr:hypothetical protein [Falsiroseomonas frigidaquae]